MPFASRGRTIPRACDLCGSIYRVKMSRLEKGTGRFCSTSCGSKSRRRPPEQVLADALAKLDKGAPNGCWEFTGGHDSYGYGSIWDGNKVVGAHVFFYERLVGPVPEGHCVLHHCDNPPCGRADPDPAISHLFTGTRGDNSLDAQAKGRTAFPYLGRGQA